MKYTNDEDTYEWTIEDFCSTRFIKLDDGTTAFNVFTMGQNLAHDMYADGYFDEDEILVTDDIILEWIIDNFKNVFSEIMREVKYQLTFNGDINKGQIKLEQR